MTTIHIRTNPKLKKNAQRVLKQLGIDMSSAMNLYLQQIVITESIPFPIRTVNGFTPEQEREMIQEAQEALKHGKRYKTVDELFDDVLKE